MRKSAHYEKSERERKRQYDKRRPSAAGRLYGWRWQRARAKFLAQPENVLCVHCKRMGKITAAREIDHIVPHRGDLKLFWDRTNWMALCRSCHSAKTMSEMHGKTAVLKGCDASGQSLDPEHPWNREGNDDA